MGAERPESPANAEYKYSTKTVKLYAGAERPESPADAEYRNSI